MQFDYSYLMTATGKLQVQDIGNCCIFAQNDLNFQWYLIIKTQLGWTTIIQYGPIISDLKQLPYNVNYSYSRFQYKQRRIRNIIQSFINDYKKSITKCQCIQLPIAKKAIRNMVEFI